MNSFKHAYMLFSTDFELEPVLEKYLSTYPDAQPRKYQIVCTLRNERVEGDYCYIVVYEHITGSTRPSLAEYIKSYCEVNGKVAKMEVTSHVFPDIAQGNYGNAAKYRKK